MAIYNAFWELISPDMIVHNLLMVAVVAYFVKRTSKETVCVSTGEFFPPESVDVKNIFALDHRGYATVQWAIK